MARTIKQRMVLRRNPRAMAIGTVRKWQDGSYVKTGKNEWARVPKRQANLVAGATKNGRAGAEMLGELLTHAKPEQIPAVAEVASLAEASLAAKRPEPEIVSVAQAVAAIYAESGPDMSWQLYCARRWAKFNPDGVDMARLPEFVRRAKEAHGGKIPEGL